MSANNASNYNLDAAGITPHSIEAEEAVLGSILTNPDLLYVAIGKLRVDSFYSQRNQWVFSAMQHLHQHRQPIDTLTITERLEAQGILSETGGAAYVFGLTNKAPQSSNIEGYAQIVSDMATRRAMLDEASDIAARAHRADLPVEQALAESVAGVTRLGANHTSGGLQPIGLLASNEFDRISAILRNHETNGRVRTHLLDLDNILYGLSGGDLITVAAPPGMGKTSWLSGLARENAARGIPVAFFSLEMTAAQLQRRNASSLMGIDYKRFERGQLSPNPRRIVDLDGTFRDLSELDEFVQYCQTVEGWPLLIDDKPAITPAYMRSAIQKAVWQYGVELVIVDYFQKMKPDYQMQEREGLDYVAKELKTIAREFGIPVVTAAALNRLHDQRQDKRPVLSDLKGTSAIEYESDIVLFLYRDSYYDNDNDDPTTEIIVSKHRNGATGTVKVMFDATHTTFRNAAH